MKFCSVGSDWDEVRKELFAEEEIKESGRRVAELSKQIEASE